MKALLLMFTLFFALAACGRGSADPREEPPYEPANEVSNDSVDCTPPSVSTTAPTEEPHYTTAPPECPPVPLPPPTEDIYEPLVPRRVEGEDFQPEHFLCDFNYLMHTLRLNFPLFGPAYRRHRMDIDRIEAATVQAIMAQNPSCPEAFSRLLQVHFFNPFRGFGHLYQNTYRSLHSFFAEIYRYGIDEHGNIIYEQTRVFYETMTAPAALRFYGEITINIGEYESGMINPNNISTGIKVESHVAYVNVRQFNHYNIEHDKAIMFAFFEEIADYNHLIIDLRQNTGGWPRYFYQIFAEPNITAPLEWHVVEFFSSGRHSRKYSDAYIADLLNFRPEDLATVSGDAAAFIAKNDMRYFNRDDLDLLQNVAVWRYSIYPATGNRMFNGRFWILVGPRSSSGVEMVATFARETGFATLVGEPTAGIMGAMTAYLLLPNSGIIVRYDFGYQTDQYGRSLEEFGVMPHYFNRPGMNALQTVLAIIEEGAY